MLLKYIPYNVIKVLDADSTSTHRFLSLKIVLCSSPFYIGSEIKFCKIYRNEYTTHYKRKSQLVNYNTHTRYKAKVTAPLI